MPKMRPTYHIIGGGAAGLSAALYLARRHPDYHITVYEATGHPGGRAYSFVAADWQMSLDNATHVILGANTCCRRFAGKDFFRSDITFRDINQNKTLRHWLHCREEIAEAVFNTAFADISGRQWLNIARQLFPFTPGKFKAGFSCGDLSGRLIDKMSASLKDIRCGWRLTGFKEKDKQLCELWFGRRKVNVKPQDRVVSALDSYHHGQLFESFRFDYHTIINIYFRTSMQITLPGGNNMLGLIGGTAQWLFSSPGLLAVTISNADHIRINDDMLARQVWGEICRIREREAAFMPDYKVLRHKRATIKQDRLNNSRRPDTAQTRWLNLQICGDWTMKNYPCCLETAIRSAYRLK